MALRRSVRKRLDLLDAISTKAKSVIVKGKERARRDARMAEKLRAGNLPFAPVVMSWLSRQLDKRSSKITQEDVQTLLS